MTEEKFTSEELERFRRALIEQGHAFQHRALHEANLAYSKFNEGWLFETIEFPVQAGRDTRIDFVLANHEIMMAVECKRVNPAYGCWLFVKAPVTRRQRRGDRLIYDGVKWNGPDRKVALFQSVPAPTGDTYQIGYAVKRNVKGDEKAEARDAVERALRQAAQGAAGLLNYYTDSPGALSRTGEIRYVIPAVFTTADLFVTDINLADKVGLDGEIKAADLHPRREDWILFEYHVEPSLRHRIHNQLRGKNLSDDLDQKYTRTIPIVNAGAIQTFLDQFNYAVITP